jgi:hypothetical protein
MRIWIRNTASFLANLRICALRHQGNFLICDLRNIHYKFADLRLRNEPKNLLICGLTAKFACSPLHRGKESLNMKNGTIYYPGSLISVA